MPSLQLYFPSEVRFHSQVISGSGGRMLASQMSLRGSAHLKGIFFSFQYEGCTAQLTIPILRGQPQLFSIHRVMPKSLLFSVFCEHCGSSREASSPSPQVDIHLLSSRSVALAYNAASETASLSKWLSRKYNSWSKTHSTSHCSVPMS